MRKLLKENKGFSGPMAILIVMFVLMLTTTIMENQRCYVIIQNADEALQAATNTVGVENMHNASTGIRESNSGAYRYDTSGDDWNTNVMAAQITEIVKQSLGLISKDGKLCLPLDYGMGYSVSQIKTTYDNAPLAGGNSETLTFTTSAQLEVPLTFMSQPLRPITLDRTVKATFMNKF